MKIMEITPMGIDGKKLSNGEIIKIREGFVVGDINNANKKDNRIVENVLSLKYKGTLLLRITIPFFDDLDQLQDEKLKNIRLDSAWKCIGSIMNSDIFNKD